MEQIGLVPISENTLKKQGSNKSYLCILTYRAFISYSFFQSLLWQYRFSFLRGSSDDGSHKIVLLFSQSPAGPFDRQVSHSVHNGLFTLNFHELVTRNYIYIVNTIEL